MRSLIVDESAEGLIEHLLYSNRRSCVPLDFKSAIYRSKPVNPAGFLL